MFVGYNVAAGVWNKGVMDTYLCTCAVDKSVPEFVWKTKNPKTTMEDDNDVTFEDDEIRDGFKPLTAYISIVPIMRFIKLVMNAYVDCGLHLVFHGVVAYCVEITKKFISNHG